MPFAFLNAKGAIDEQEPSQIEFPIDREQESMMVLLLGECYGKQSFRDGAAKMS